ncbi:MAG: Gfo/Idh/MocA family oxidoreductase [Rhodospirillaceae bacterium]|jgi:predicted dehydrogenase|nr:Gfo/Idh/MocA family oxidoreductase [Rhodospirillaceae bacterium]MBT5192542.1 Gfo/Idh/MocA family oxidoreductase [Rhodospirillaceae bacterium]MBT5897746.1 Gfo/Idh/MocA family oxidoreductase [Rhodospirillaceae bacterium]
MTTKIKILVVGLGNMGLSHAKAYHTLDGFEIVGLCSRNIATITDLPPELDSYPKFNDYAGALAALAPDAVSINTWPDTHAEFAVMAFEAGAHVFLEKPVAETVPDAERVIAAARRHNRKLVIGYILRHHPSWAKLVELSHGLGKPLVMRMNLNQQSSGATWNVHKQLMSSISPIVDCGVHYVDMMCLMARAKPVKVHAIGAHLSNEIATDMYNYGQLQVTFDDGSVGWYEAGWGPMMSETAFFVKDVIGPKGCVSIIAAEETGQGHKSDDVDAHTKTNALRLHHGALTADGNFERSDEIIKTTEEPGHDDLCRLEQEFFLKAITEDLDLEEHMTDVLNSLRIVLAADQSIRTGEVVRL